MMRFLKVWFCYELMVFSNKGRTIRNVGKGGGGGGGGQKFPVHEFFFSSAKVGCRNIFSHVEGLHEFFSIVFNYVMETSNTY